MKMKEDVYMFIGSSGSGKGTQAALLRRKLQSMHPGKEIFYLETGANFREFIHQNTFTAEHTRKMIEEGKLPPAFLGVHVWSHELINNYKEDQIVLIDGTPRMGAEVSILLSAFEFYNWHPHVLNIKVSDDWSFKHLKLRGREDDIDDKSVKERISWFHENVAPAIELLRQGKNLTVHDIDGEHTIEEVHESICKALNLNN
jgi:adenylate kinase family enzyme